MPSRKIFKRIAIRLKRGVQDAESALGTRLDELREVLRAHEETMLVCRFFLIRIIPVIFGGILAILLFGFLLCRLLLF